MSQTQRVSGVATSIRGEEGRTIIRYHNTDVVSFNDKDVILNTGGWKTATTKTRMNQASHQFRLDYEVVQRKGEWFIMCPAGTIPFEGDKIILGRNSI